MSNAIYPEWWNTTITIYNKYTDPQTEIVKWYKSVIHGVFWKYIGDKIAIGKTVLETNNIICRIRKDDRFLEQYQWLQIPNDKMSEYFTIGKGDIIVKGEVNDEINEYQKGHHSTDLINKYKDLQGCMTIERVAINVGAGRCDEHYYVKGI